MAEKSLKSRIQLKYDTETNWEKATNFIPKSGEVIIYATDSEYEFPRMKVGDGITNVNNLPFILNLDTAPTIGSNNAVTSDGIRRAIDAAMPEEHTIYGFHIDSTESDPSACVTYLADAVGMTPAAMDFTNDHFNWGSWAGAFFLPRPCMLRYDGTVAYYLDPFNYAQKADGTASDVTDDTFQGNAMMEWGRDGKKIWYKIVPDTGDNTSASVYIADYQVGSDYHAWSFINNQGEMVDHFYTPIYNGSIDSNGRLRSISGKTYTQLCQDKTVAEEMAAAELNNPSTDKLWYTEVSADVTLINLLLILMGKSLNTQATFGNGLCSGPGSTSSSMLETGTMNDTGLFWGSDAFVNGVKVFGMENWWGNQYRRYAGEIIVNGRHKYKMTRGTQDGSEADDYNLTGSGYISGATTSLLSGTFITKMKFNQNGFIVSSGDGASATYWCDTCFTSLGDTYYPLRGGDVRQTTPNGAFMYNFAGTVTSSNWYMGAAPSCKPLL